MGVVYRMVQGRRRVSNIIILYHAMDTWSTSPNCSRSPVSSAAIASPSASEWTDDQVLLNTTIYGINTMSIRDSRPKNILKCLEADRRDSSRSAQLYRQLYLSDGLAKADHMYTTDVKGHHGCVNTLALSNQGEEFLVSAGDDQRVLVWRVADMIQAGSRTPRPIIMTSQHSANVFTADFSCDNQCIYSGGDDSVLIKHDFNTGHPISHLEHLDAIYSVAPHPSSPSIVLTASEDGCIYTIDTRQPFRRVDSSMMLCESTEAYHCAVFNPVEPSLVAVCNSYSGTALYDTRQRKRVVRYRCTTWPIVREDAVSACFDRTGQQLYVMHRVLPPVLYDLWHDKARLSFMDNTGSYRNVVTMKSGCFMGQNDEYVVSGSDDFRVYIWKIPNTRRGGMQLYLEEGMLTMNMSTMPHLILPGHRSIVNQTCYSRVHHVLASSGVEKIIKIWSHERLNSSQKVSHSRAPPSRSRYSIRERDELINETPADPLNEDTSVLALFDALIEEDEDGSDLSLTSSDDDDDDNDSDNFYLMEDERRLRHVMRAFPPFFGRGFRLFSDDDDSDATPTDSELSCANTSSLEPPWSMDEDLWSNESDMEGLDEEPWEMYAGDGAAWGSSDSEPSLSEEEKQSGRIIGIYGGGEAGGRDKNKDEETGGGSTAGVKKERTRKIIGPSGSQTSGESACGSGCGSSRSGTQPQPTRRCQPLRKAKKTTAASASSSKENTKKIASASASASKESTSSTVAEKKRRESSFAAGGSSQPKPKKDEGSGSKSGNSKRYQPKRKVKSSSACSSAATGCDSNVVGAMNSEPLASSSSSSMAKPKRSGSGSRAVANGNGSESSGRGSRAVADGNGETSSSGPSQRWTRKRNRRQQEANGTAADNYEQYRAEDFLKAKSPKSFYAKKKDPP